MTYPTANEMLFHKDRILSRDTHFCLNRAAELTRSLLRGEVDDLEIRLRAKDEVVAALHNARRYDLQRRAFGHKLPG